CQESSGVVVGWCGDGVPQFYYSEECDAGIENGTADCSYGETGCYVCTDMCKQVEGNVVGWCGDGVIQRDDCSGYSNCVEVPGINEECDSGNDNGWSGFCSEDCSYMTSCGDGTVDLGEICDTTDVQCSDYSQFVSGTLACPVDCSIPDASGCVEDPAYVSPFFTTSQSLCYNNTAQISCPAFGDPFYGQEPQFNYTSQSFSVSGDVVEEFVSGLMWQKDTPSAYSGCTKGTGSSQCTLAESIQYCEDLDLGGFEDWRLPTSYELGTVVNYTQTPSLIFSDFINTQSSDYWTLDAVVSFSDGFVSSEDPVNGAYVKCVRGDLECAGCNFFGSQIEGNLAILPISLNLSEVIFWYFNSSDPLVSWEDALSYCEGTVENGLSKFRLPTINELHSLVDRSASNPAS
ncbi:MAG TPA: DUF1566 domain-containing protein, partial [bacterium]|nr:DUF1566 domain-containing protein [bacterium]